MREFYEPWPVSVKEGPIAGVSRLMRGVGMSGITVIQ